MMKLLLGSLPCKRWMCKFESPVLGSKSARYMKSAAEINLADHMLAPTKVDSTFVEAPFSSNDRSIPPSMQLPPGA